MGKDDSGEMEEGDIGRSTRNAGGSRKDIGRSKGDAGKLEEDLREIKGIKVQIRGRCRENPGSVQGDAGGSSGGGTGRSIGICEKYRRSGGDAGGSGGSMETQREVFYRDLLSQKISKYFVEMFLKSKKSMRGCLRE
jgi:hypothetical protein